jgi:hypothetical protein
MFIQIKKENLKRKLMNIMWEDDIHHFIYFYYSNRKIIYFEKVVNKFFIFLKFSMKCSSCPC